MRKIQTFLSIVFVVRNRSQSISETVSDAINFVESCVDDFEFIVVDNCSDDGTVAVLKNLVDESELPNLQVYALTSEATTDTAIWAGLENAIGDYVAVVDPGVDDIRFARNMVENAVGGADVVYAVNEKESNDGLIYRTANRIFHSLYKWLSGVNVSRDSPRYRVMSRAVVNYILQHPQPDITYRHLPVSGAFENVTLSYASAVRASESKNFRKSAKGGLSLLFSTSTAPMRIVTTLSLFGASANGLYSLYVIGVAVFKENRNDGWISMSLQLSGMFFLISLVLLVLGEYVLMMVQSSSQGPRYHIGREFASSRQTLKAKVNVESISSRIVASELAKSESKLN